MMPICQLSTEPYLNLILDAFCRMAFTGHLEDVVLRSITENVRLVCPVEHVAHNLFILREIRPLPLFYLEGIIMTPLAPASCLQL